MTKSSIKMERCDIVDAALHYSLIDAPGRATSENGATRPLLALSLNNIRVHNVHDSGSLFRDRALDSAKTLVWRRHLVWKQGPPEAPSSKIDDASFVDVAQDHSHNSYRAWRKRT